MEAVVVSGHFGDDEAGVRRQEKGALRYACGVLRASQEFSHKVEVEAEVESGKRMRPSLL
ncbi:MAG: hypothetical protein A2268_15230 [Candidatus Raymondbacteria bacterium RifOxyA12_full_50_37]|uniref:Uncharacterized protein n=1 Tax=Candidatus Raymondbacteria bacterium RIFOXYD12_FULL_49_13 TaxID=1817890 RepID=A0A1F7F749_UNCRA|nr:MAG: hypothetical protein A2268_15230 [Candidatus Raymondbacteria bacterium RifOxyA12_full_50_37]OGJ88492.1 MAG: hypothetical protein A2248_20035 [Candidatus Raymondbacteria bacterium RIFOXYA2_FULL_49_16]OGJ90626.1 MAG: hypothetical protein A2350_18480 [Candidatus Raymondbacteria bacterium RifOxyB12_full_50_8]OGJ96196.1 MAG: hypothetical protein A2487_01410 [Candidatus Raymondbacteria bacterium RifOxyC12_full_50_8]OGJ98952.1 MAG: hypothetical protein A2453_10750 [Candidatus Raymondbacteria b